MPEPRHDPRRDRNPLPRAPRVSRVAVSRQAPAAGALSRFGMPWHQSLLINLIKSLCALLSQHNRRTRRVSPPRCGHRNATIRHDLPALTRPPRPSLRRRRAVRRRQDLARACVDGARAQPALLYLLYDAPAAADRDPRSRLLLCLEGRVRGDGRARRVPGARAGLRQLLRHGAGPGGSVARRRPGPDPGDRLAGGAADSPGAARVPFHLHPAALARRSSNAGCAAAAPTPRT